MAKLLRYIYFLMICPDTITVQTTMHSASIVLRTCACVICAKGLRIRTHHVRTVMGMLAGMKGWQV